MQLLLIAQLPFRVSVPTKLECQDSVAMINILWPEIGKPTINCIEAILLTSNENTKSTTSMHYCGTITTPCTNLRKQETISGIGAKDYEPWKGRPLTRMLMTHLHVNYVRFSCNIWLIPNWYLGDSPIVLGWYSGGYLAKWTQLLPWKLL
jgi:hypothetical protein